MIATNQAGKGPRNTVLATPGNAPGTQDLSATSGDQNGGGDDVGLVVPLPALRKHIVAVFGPKVADTLEPLEVELDGGMRIGG